jgi:putative transposase
MNNHIHLVINPGTDHSLSRIMQWILSVFAMRWNRKHNLTGHVWGDRFFSRIIAGIVDYLRVFMYIDANPVKAFLADCPWQWEYGGLWHHRHGIITVVDEPEPIVLDYLPCHRPG